MPDLSDSRPLCAVYVVWHPGLKNGSDLARGLYQHFRRDLFTNVSGGVGLSVLYRSVSSLGSDVPREIDFSDSHVTVAFLLVSAEIGDDPSWRSYTDTLLEAAAPPNATSRVIPIAIDGAALDVLHGIQALRYDRWAEADRQLRLKSSLTYELCKLLRIYIAHAEQTSVPIDELEMRLEKACIFLSHSKNDERGEEVAELIRHYIFESTALRSFLDVHDIPPGLPFADVLKRYVRTSAVIAIHTDSYSSREWCRREIIEAKRANVPLIVADCIDDIDERGFPYMSNVPIVRMEKDAAQRIPHVIARLLDELFKDYLWKARLSHDGRTLADPNIVYLPRQPELIALAGMGVSRRAGAITVVYPDPALGAEELQLFADVRDGVVLRSYTEFAAQFGGSP